MVHKRYIKIRGKTYGPYYYESYREGSKVKKRYLKIPHEKERRVKSFLNQNKIINLKLLIIFYLIFIVILMLLAINRYSAPFFSEREDRAVLLAPPGASVGASDNANLSIWDDTDLGENRFSGILVNFYANYTNSVGNVIDNLNGNCLIRYDYTGVYTNYDNMVYDINSLLWKSSRTFNYKGIHNFEVDCRSDLGNVSLTNNFVISNSEPDIKETPGGSLDFDNNIFNNDILGCVEDILCLYNISANVSDPDVNDMLVFDYIPGPNSTLTNFAIDPQTGILSIDINKDADTGQKIIELTVIDSDGARDTATLSVSITPVNDAPVFINLINKSFNISMLFEYNIIANDEEGNVPFSFNITFLSCETAQWSTRTNCELFNTSQYSVNGTAINISFTPSRNDVGSYIINFSVSDSGIPSAIRSEIINFTVLNINSEPWFRYVCDNEREAVEDLEFNCYINASDIDEVNNLTFSSNANWFLDFKSVIVNSTTNFNGSILVNFTATDKNVGNWSINVTVRDTGIPIMQNSSTFYFFVDNINDRVKLQDLPTITAYTSNNYSVYINASDDDLLIPDKNVYNEILSFSSNASWVYISSVGIVSGTNITRALIEFDPNNAPGSGQHVINISTSDANGFSIDSKILTINIIGNFKPVWLNPAANHVLTEDNEFYLNLSENVTDPEGDAISFSFSSDTGFPSFSLNAGTGVINLTPSDIDVGQHIVIINASDVATPSPFTFNFSVSNINDLPIIETPLQGNNVTIDLNSNMEIMEDNRVEIFLFVKDEDLKIPLGQKDFYNENLVVNSVIEGANSNLFSFVEPIFLPPERLIFSAIFTPKKSDVGFYNVTVNVSDASGALATLSFNLSIFEINHPPTFINLTDQATIIDRELFYNIEAFDIEDGDDSTGNLTYSYKFLADGRMDDFIGNDERIFNKTSGILNVTFINGQGGAYHLNISVNDSIGLQNTEDFWVFVYDLPIILSPPANFVFNLKEGNATNLTFVANSSGIGNLSYQFYINDNLRYSTIYYGDGTPIKWMAIPEFSDETYGLFGNLTLTVSIPNFLYLNNSRTWNANITHANAPIGFLNNIGDKQGIYGKDIVINLSEHFSDFDAFDVYYNQSASFIVRSNANQSAISYSVSNWILSLSASSAVVEILNITGNDLNGGVIMTSAMSNNFKVEFIEPISVPVPVPEPVPVPAGGSGGSSTEKLVSLKIIHPGPVSAKRGETIILPIEIFNDGPTTLNGIDIGSLVVKDGKIRNEFNVSLSKRHIVSLASGARENLTLTANVGFELGLFEITVNASVQEPKYYDWGKIFINFEEGETVIEKLVFTEEFIVENPECAEVKELVDESREYLAIGDFDSARVKLDEAADACKEAISKNSFFSGTRLKAKLQDKIFIYLFVATILSVVLGISYYVFRRRALKKALEEVSKMSFEKT